MVAEAETADGKRYLEVRYINRISPRDNLAANDAIFKLSAMAKGTLASKGGDQPF